MISFHLPFQFIFHFAETPIAFSWSFQLIFFRRDYHELMIGGKFPTSP